jgi:NitT/TauT family transport system permease protein
MTIETDDGRVRSGRDPAAHATPAEGDPTSRATRPALLERRGVRILLGCVLPLLVLLFWQYEAGQDSNTLGFLATPAQVAATFVELAGDGTLLDSVWASLSRILGGVGIAVAIGVPVGILVGTSRFVEAVLWPFVELVRQVPIPAWVPFMVLFLGIGNRPAILLIALASFFPIFLNTVSGVRQIPAIHLRAGRMLGANRVQMLTRVVLPSALPTVLTGIRVGTGIGVMVVVLAELIAVRSGVGYLILLGQVQFHGDYVITGMITISVLGWLLSKAIGGVERIVMRHRAP